MGSICHDGKKERRDSSCIPETVAVQISYICCNARTALSPTVADQNGQRLGEQAGLVQTLLLVQALLQAQNMELVES